MVVVVVVMMMEVVVEEVKGIKLARTNYRPLFDNTRCKMALLGKIRTT